MERFAHATMSANEDAETLGFPFIAACDRGIVRAGTSAASARRACGPWGFGTACIARANDASGGEEIHDQSFDSGQRENARVYGDGRDAGAAERGEAVGQHVLCRVYARWPGRGAASDHVRV